MLPPEISPVLGLPLPASIKQSALLAQNGGAPLTGLPLPLRVRCLPSIGLSVCNAAQSDFAITLTDGVAKSEGQFSIAAAKKEPGSGGWILALKFYYY